MTRPRVFISSTFYDLRHIRDDLERFIRSLGYDSVRHETGRIPYSRGEKLEDSVYRELEFCDILVCIIGGRFGAESSSNKGQSITQSELKRAIEKNIQVYVFVTQDVHAEYFTYLANKSTPDFKTRHADDIRIHEYLEQIYSLSIQNPIFQFETFADLQSVLLEQWAGLFQRYLQLQKSAIELNTISELTSTAQTLRELVNFLTEERRADSAEIGKILLANHPIFPRLARLTGTAYRIYFTNREEMARWLRARGWQEVSENAMDKGSTEEWLDRDGTNYIKFTKNFFDSNENLKFIDESQWDDQWITIHKNPDPVPPSDPDDDIPF